MSLVEPRRTVLRRAFTLVEMIVVIAIILVIVGLVVPSVSALWNQRKFASAVNTLQGMLMVARTEALRADGVDTGILFYLDEEGTQHLALLEQARPPEGLLAIDRAAWQNIFVVKPDRALTLPPPMRLVPRQALDAETSGATFEGFSDPELANNDFATPPSASDQAQRHRNFFSMIYSTDGQLIVGRDVLIQDAYAVAALSAVQNVGDRTGLPVGVGEPDDPEAATTTQYYLRDNRNGQRAPIDPQRRRPFPYLVSDDRDVAINFSSVDGLLVYDDSLFNDAFEPPQKRAMLRRDAQPLYVSRWTGVVIRGSAGENAAP